jgi:hypothetical protein
MRPSTNDDPCLSPANPLPVHLDTKEPNVDSRHLHQLGDQYLRRELEMRVPGQVGTPVVVEVATPIEPDLLLVYWCC